MNFCFFLALFAQIVALISASSCDANKKENKCMTASSDVGKCSWCSSGAVGSACYEEADAKSLPSSIFECEYQKATLKATTCDANKKENKCMTASSDVGKCSWCSSGAVGSACYEEADAKSLPSSIFECEYQKTTLKATTCDANKKENKCMTASSDAGKCSWCSSGAVGSACYEEADAKSLPSSIFECEYQKTALKATSCDGLKESACMKNSAGSEKCSWCNSAAVGGSCFTETDAKSLPSSVFQCEYQKSLKLQKATSCDGVTSEKTCMGSTFDGNKCSWCTSGAVGASCFNEVDAKTLPSSVFECEYQKATYANLRGN